MISDKNISEINTHATILLATGLNDNNNIGSNQRRRSHNSSTYELAYTK
jgi:hypothetical protein